MVICIVGLGYVGLPLSLAFSEKKIKVIGIEKTIDWYLNNLS
jgi:UDP-N-acetyl-D-mannosaminuronate dehydrogenase